jgi:hypothetical protein
MRDESILRRLAAKSRMEGECLVWTGAKHSNGYGSITIGGRKGRRESTHRAAWIARHGEPPAEKPFVLHKCDNPPCWRDEHLFLGTHADNMEDMRRKGRSKWSRGHGQRRCEDAPGAKLTNAQVSEIKRRLMAGETQRSIAAIYGVSFVAIGHIKRGRNFIEVPWPDPLEVSDEPAD